MKAGTKYLLTSAMVALLVGYWFFICRFGFFGKASLEQRGGDAIAELHKSRHREFSADEWRSLVSWTQIAWFNCFNRNCVLSKSAYRNFVEEIESRVNDDPGIEFFEWFWQRVEREAKDGEAYTKAFSPLVDGRYKKVQASK